MGKLRRFISLERGDRRLLLYAALVLTVTRLALRVLAFHRWRGWVPWLTRRRRPLAPAARPSVDRVKWAVEAAVRAVPGATCLSAALTCQALLWRYGYAADLHVGVCVRSGHRLEAHAWVERDGQVVLGNTGDLTGYHRLLPAGDRET